VGKRVRSETELAVGSRSLAGAAVAALSRALGGVRRRSFLVLGTGEMGAIAARQLKERGAAHVLLCNRTARRAEELAARLDVETRPWEWREALLSQVDGVVCATGSKSPILRRQWLRTAIADRSQTLAVADLGVPRNVEPIADPPDGLVSIDIESLSRRMEEDRRRQAKAVTAAEVIVEGELRDWTIWAETGRGASSTSGCRARRGLAAG
jgi:glutamyl-tRNA reductase